MVATIGKPTHAGDHLLQPSNVAPESSAPDDTRLLPGPRSYLRRRLCEQIPWWISFCGWNDKCGVSADYHRDYDPDHLLTTYRRCDSNFSFSQLDHTNHSSPAGSRLP